MSEIKLGVIAKDKVTGFCGTITARVEYLNGSIQYELTPRCEEKNMMSAVYPETPTFPASGWVDENRIEVINK